MSSLYPIDKIGLKEVIAPKEQIGIFLLKYFYKSKEKRLRIALNYVYGLINSGFCNKLEEELTIDEIFHVIKNKISEIEGAKNKN